jgi:hypothetical protein
LAEEEEGEEEQDGGRGRAGRGIAGGAAGRPCQAAGGTVGRRRPAAGRQQSSTGRLRFWRLRFEDRLPARSRESPSASHTLGQTAAYSARWGEACNFMFFILLSALSSQLSRLSHAAALGSRRLGLRRSLVCSPLLEGSAPNLRHTPIADEPVPVVEGYDALAPSDWCSRVSTSASASSAPLCSTVKGK